MKHTAKKTNIPVGKQRPYQKQSVARISKEKKIIKQLKLK